MRLDHIERFERMLTKLGFHQLEVAVQDDVDYWNIGRCSQSYLFYTKEGDQSAEGYNLSNL